MQIGIHIFSLMHWHTCIILTKDEIIYCLILNNILSLYVPIENNMNISQTKEALLRYIEHLKLDFWLFCLSVSIELSVDRMDINFDDNGQMRMDWPVSGTILSLSEQPLFECPSRDMTTCACLSNRHVYYPSAYSCCGLFGYIDERIVYFWIKSYK